MKKYIVLFFVVSFLGACVSMVPPAIRVDNAIEKVGGQYAITESVSVAVSGQYAQNIEEVFYDFGFRISKNPDYTIQVEAENLGWGRTWGYQVYPVKIRIRVRDNRSSQEYFYKANGTFQYYVSYYSGHNGTQHYPNDPYGLAAKNAAVEAIGDFIQEQKIPHRQPKT